MDELILPGDEEMRIINVTFRALPYHMAEKSSSFIITPQALKNMLHLFKSLGMPKLRIPLSSDGIDLYTRLGTGLLSMVNKRSKQVLIEAITFYKGDFTLIMVLVCLGYGCTVCFAMSTQQDIYAAGSESRPPMLNKENYIPWSSRLLRYAKSRPNGKLIHNSILNGPYVIKMIPEPGDANRDINITETSYLQTDDELSDKELKKIEADDQAIQTILLGLPKDIYAVVDSCETAQEIQLRVQQMMKGSDIKIQEKKAKLFNEWERFTSNEGESIESYYHRFLKLMNDLKRNKHFPEKIASNLKFLNNLQPKWSRHVTIVHQTKDLHTADYTQLYDFLKYNQKEMVRGNGRNQFRQYTGQNIGNSAGYNDVIGNQKKDPFPPLSKMMNMKSRGLQVVMCLEIAISCPPSPVGNSLLGHCSAASGPSSSHLWKVGSVTTYTLPFTPYHRAFSLVAGFGGSKLTWLRQKASSLKARLTRLKGESHASVCGSWSHTLIPTGSRSRPTALPKPIIISVPRPHCWKGSASKPYVELSPHTAPLGMESGIPKKRKNSLHPYAQVILLPGLDHVSQTISVHMAQDDSIYRGQNRIRKMEFLDFLTRPRLRVLWTLRPPATSGSKHLEGNFYREGFNPATEVMGDHWSDALGETYSQGVTGGVYRARSSALALIKLMRTLEKKGLRLRKASATFLLIAQLRAGTQLVALPCNTCMKVSTIPLRTCFLVHMSRAGRVFHVLAGPLIRVDQGRTSLFTAWTTSVSNPVRSLCFHTSASVGTQRAAFAFGVPSYIYGFHPYTRNSTLLCLTQVNWFREHSATFWRLSFSTQFTAYVPFTPSHFEEHLPPRLTAAAGTELAGVSSSSLVMIAHSTKELYKWHYPSLLTRYYWIGLSPIVQDSPLLSPVGVQAVSQS
nr:Gag-Pol polyprotein [Tanacetum cinerariifolium]